MSAPSDAVRPVIGICAVHERARWSFWDQPAHLVAGSYVRAVQDAGGIAVLLPIDSGAEARLLELVDGLLLAGGADIDPAAYGAEPEPATERTDPDRDGFELAMLNSALQRDLPVLAICRGMQVLNVAFGGTLRQDLAGPDGGNIHRRRLGSFDEAGNHIALEPGSLVARAARESMHVACCHHHQAIDAVGEGLVVTGRAVEDGLPEAIEADDGRWVLGVQWHPEAEPGSVIVAAFVAASRARADGVSKARGTPRAPSRSRGRRSAAARGGA
jgi:putative glutamine amidotransferase